MKKTLVFLLFVCISLFTLTGCGKGVSTKKLATEEEYEEYMEDKLDALEEMFEEEFSYSFKCVIKTKKADATSEYTQTRKIEGRVSVDMNDLEKTSAYVKTTTTLKGTEYSKSGKNRVSTKGTIERTVVDGKFYELCEVTQKHGESKYEDFTKTKYEIPENIVLEQIITMIDGIGFEKSFDGEKIYIDGDKCLLVTSTLNEHREITLKFNGDKLESVQYVLKTNTTETKIAIEYGKIKSISKPSKSSEYKNIGLN